MELADALAALEAAGTAAAVAAAERIGPFIVDHGDTGCVAPAAIPYIERTIAHREAQAAPRAAKGAISRATAASR
jgi:hypothetical protein